MQDYNIQMVDLKGQYKQIKLEVDKALLSVIEEGAFINGPDVKQFAREFAEYTSVEYVIPCGNGTDALQIAMMALNFQPGDEVIIPAFTYVAALEVIGLLGLTPILIDVLPTTFELDVSQLTKKISKKTVAIVPVHLFGQCSNMEEIMAIANLYGLKVIEDTAQAIGANYTFKNGTVKKAGTIGHIGTTSFFPSKNLGCYGDGGAIFTNDYKLSVRLNMIANHGQRKKYIHEIIGINSRLDTIQAAILRIKLKHLDKYNHCRNIVADRYDDAFKGHPNIIIPERVTFSTHVFHQYTLKIEGASRDGLKDYLSSHNIPAMIYYPIPLHLQEAYLGYGFNEGDFPQSEDLCKKVISLPIHTELDIAQQEHIIKTVKAYFQE
jgi:UDP-2-acetamido-2-deoxy-ribo-hexuluronate aminotransferase